MYVVGNHVDLPLCCKVCCSYGVLSCEGMKSAWVLPSSPPLFFGGLMNLAVPKEVGAWWVTFRQPYDPVV